MPKKTLIKNLPDIKDLDKGEIERLSRIFSDKVGIINAILERKELEKYGLSMFQCLSAKAKVLFGLDREVSSGGLGIGYSPRKALFACLAEAIERYSMSYANEEDLLFGFWKDLSVPHKPGRLHFYSDKQYKANLEFFDPKSSKIFWVKLKNFLTPSRYLYWPASLIYLPFKYGRPVAETSSTGVAANTSIRKAVTSGLLELIERDALMINFLQRLNPPEIDINTINDRNRALIKEIRRSYNLKIYKLYSDIRIPIFLGFIWRRNKGGLHYGIGACADLGSEKSIQKTLKECLFTYFYSKNIMDLKPKKKEEIKALYEHFLYYQDSKFFQLLFKKSMMCRYEREVYSIDYLLKELKRNKFKVFFKDLTTPDIKDTGIKVVRTVVPGLIDLNKTYKLRREGALRFWEMPNNLGLKTFQVLSRFPHPFP